MHELGEQVEDVVRLLVDSPDDVAVDFYPSPGMTRVEVAVAQPDLGKVIGRQGKTARALRTLLAARGAGDGERYELEILED